jgi:hypothetical protein
VRPTPHGTRCLQRLVWAAVACAWESLAQGHPLPATPGVPIQAIAAGVAHADAAVRLHAASLLADDRSAQGVTLLYLLANDVEADVQAEALTAALRRCPRESAAVCANMVQFFVGDADDSETHWQARDWLLIDAPREATAAASREYKLDVVARMGERVDQPDLNRGALRVLRVLADDPEPEVQEAASAVLLRAKL